MQILKTLFQKNKMKLTKQSKDLTDKIWEEEIQENREKFSGF